MSKTMPGSGHPHPLLASLVELLRLRKRAPAEADALSQKTQSLKRSTSRYEHLDIPAMADFALARVEYVPMTLNLAGSA